MATKTLVYTVEHDQTAAMVKKTFYHSLHNYGVVDSMQFSKWLYIPSSGATHYGLADSIEFST